MTDTTRVPAIVELKTQLESRKDEFRFALGQSGITPERFVRTIVTAIQVKPEILVCDRASIITACMQAAGDGLLLDNREAALVKYNVKVGDQWVDKAQYMPMKQGVLKKMRNSGEVATVTVHVVHEKDEFHYEYGDIESLSHKPYLGDDEPGAMRAAYAVVTLKGGEIIRKVMTKRQIEKRMKASKSYDRKTGEIKGPWRDWPEEMWEKTALRAIAPLVPSSSDRNDLLDLVSRDDDMYDLTPQEDAPAPRPGIGPKRESRGAALLAAAVVEESTVTDVVDETASVAPVERDIVWSTNALAIPFTQAKSREFTARLYELMSQTQNANEANSLKSFNSGSWVKAKLSDPEGVAKVEALMDEKMKGWGDS